MTITVTSWKPAHNSGVILGTFDIVVPKWGGFYINGLTLCEKNGGKWINFPSRTYEKDGQKKYHPYCGFTIHDTTDRFRDAVLKALDEYLKTNQPSIFDNPKFGHNGAPGDQNDLGV